MNPRLYLISAFVLHFFFASAQTGEVQTVMQQYRYRDAIDLLENLPSTRENLLLKAESYEKLYRFGDALAIYEQLLPGNPGDVELLISAAECACRQELRKRR